MKIMRGLLMLVTIISLLVACGHNGEKKQYDPGDRAGADTSLVNLEHSTSYDSLLCQRWSNKQDDSDALNVAEGFEMPYRSFYLFPDGNMVKDARDQVKIGTWKFDAGTNT